MSWKTDGCGINKRGITDSKCLYLSHTIGKPTVYVCDSV